MILAKASGGRKSGPKRGGQFRGGRGKATFLKSMAMGERLGEDAFSIKLPTIHDHTMHFHFEIKVLQWFLHEGSNWEGSINLNALDRGRVALRTYFLNNKNNKEYRSDPSKWLRQRSWVS